MQAGPAGDPAADNGHAAVHQHGCSVIATGLRCGHPGNPWRSTARGGGLPERKRRVRFVRHGDRDRQTVRQHREQRAALGRHSGGEGQHARVGRVQEFRHPGGGQVPGERHRVRHAVPRGQRVPAGSRGGSSAGSPENR
ncbi:hypothetical protein AB0C10_01235 [Microbispora amethystogenes]|uniref:hypothetical protein n=1 Tax=Microbispora amethystogenes TaxID=1427754 RepID=UPI0033F591CE